MDRLPSARAATRTVAQFNDAVDLRAVIVDALTAAQVDERALRDGVWTYVREERQVGVAPGLVILALTEMVAEAGMQPETALVRTRQMILWCVEAYFGHLGDDALGRETAALSDASGHDAQTRANP